MTNFLLAKSLLEVSMCREFLFLTTFNLLSIDNLIILVTVKGELKGEIIFGSNLFRLCRLSEKATKCIFVKVENLIRYIVVW